MSTPRSQHVRACRVLVLFIRLILIAGGLNALLLASPSAVSAISDEEVRLIREIEEIRYTIEHTEWTWENRDQKKAYEDKLNLLTRILSQVGQRKSTSFPSAPIPQRPRDVSSEEVRLIREIEELKEEIAKTEWTWKNRDRKTELEKRLQFLERTLPKTGP